MKKNIVGWVILVFAILAVCLTAVYFIIPKAAAITLPFRWNSIPLDQKRDFVHQYFGQPADSLSEAFTDKWLAQRNNGQYVLKIHYTKDSISDGYKLFFNYKLSFFTKEYLLQEK